MNVYEAIETVYVAAVQPKYAKKGNADALAAVRELLDAYAALAPDWSNAPEWAQWVTVFDNGKRVWWEIEPFSFIDPRGDYAWREKNGRMGMAISEMTSSLPIGIDWRLCKWSREVTA